METKNQNVSFLKDVKWLLNDLVFLSDVMQHLAQLNGQLQGRNQLANKMFEHITSFQRKLVLFKDQFSNSVLTHFSCLKMQHDEGQDINYQKYGTMIEKLSAVFDAHFLDFRQLESDFNIFSNPFNTAVDQSLDRLQLELIDLQSDNDMKRAFDENDLVNFYKNYVRGKHQNLVDHALKTISLFGSTYCCKQFFSKMKYYKGKQRGQLSNQHLKSQL